MLDLGPFAGFVWAAYLATAAVIVSLIGWLIADGRRHQRALEDLEARGVRRRSASE